MDNIKDEKYIALICNGEFDTIPGFTIGELFESFFDNINYNVVKEENKTFVDFTGETICNDEESEILIRFYTNGINNEFSITEVKVNDEPLEEEEVIELLDDIAFMAETMYEEDPEAFDELDEEYLNNNEDEDYNYYDDSEKDDDENDEEKNDSNDDTIRF